MQNNLSRNKTFYLLVNFCLGTSWPYFKVSSEYNKVRDQNLNNSLALHVSSLIHLDFTVKLIDEKQRFDLKTK